MLTFSEGSSKQQKQMRPADEHTHTHTLSLSAGLNCMNSLHGKENKSPAQSGLLETPCACSPSCTVIAVERLLSTAGDTQ